MVSRISLLFNLLRNTRFNLRLIFIRHLNFVCPDKVGAVNHFQFHSFALNFTLLPSNAEILACILLTVVTVTVVDQRKENPARAKSQLDSGIAHGFRQSLHFDTLRREALGARMSCIYASVTTHTTDANYCYY